jgi:RNA polymerase sigma factor (sigma-70 family)
MAGAQLENLLKHLYGLLPPQGTDRLSDAELLGRFSSSRDETAFAALVRRHGPLVLQVCQRLLHDPATAEDVFQAAFLVLARKGHTLRKPEAVGSFLYGVAYRLAHRARVEAARRKDRERHYLPGSAPDPLAELSGRELLAVLEGELNRLPSKYRLPLVLCCLQGCTRDEAAEQLGLALRTLQRRLEQGRALLHSRLTRRGLALSSLLLGTLLSPPAASAVPVPLFTLTMQTARAFAARSAGRPARAVVLAEGMLRTMYLTKVKVMASLMLTLALLTVGMYALAPRSTQAQPAPGPAATNTELRSALAAPPAKPALPVEKERIIRTDDALAAGLQWLVRRQQGDGRWRLDGGPKNDIAATAFALLPLLRAGHTHQRSDALHPYAKHVERGLKFLRNEQRKDGQLGPEMYSHALAARTLCEAYGATADSVLKGPAQRALDFIVQAQHEGGGWRYAPRQPGDTSVTSYQVLTLVAGRTAGLTVPDETLTRAGRYLDSVVSQDGCTYGYVPGSPGTPTMTAAGHLCRLLLGGKTDDKNLVRWSASLRPLTPLGGKNDLYCRHYITLALSFRGGDDWEFWEPRMRKLLLDRQAPKDEAEHGSWPTAGEQMAASGGRLMMTSLALLTLQTCARADRVPAIPGRELTPRELANLYDSLSGRDFVEARHALRTLAASPRSTVPFLQKVLRPVPPADGRQIERWIADLDSEDFNVRQRATKELEKLDDLAHPALHKALANRPTAEARRRIEQVLEATEAGGSPAQRRAVRVVQVLVQVGSPEARRLLEGLTAGAPDAQLTRAARAGLQGLRWSWKKDDLGKLPAGWKAAQTGEGKGSVWKIVADDSAPSKSGLVLAQAAAGPRSLFNLCVAEDGEYKDVEVQVAFKAVRGKEDQGGGIVWRYQDANNYYVARMNPLEDNYRVYKVVAGKRIQLGTEEDLKVPAGQWHVLKIKQAGEHIECWLDGKKYLDAKDGTFTRAGKIGLWTKADAQTYFDQPHVTGR